MTYEDEKDLTAFEKVLKVLHQAPKLRFGKQNILVVPQLLKVCLSFDSLFKAPIESVIAHH